VWTVITMRLPDASTRFAMVHMHGDLPDPVGRHTIGRLTPLFKASLAALMAASWYGRSCIILHQPQTLRRALAVACTNPSKASRLVVVEDLAGLRV